MLLWCEKPHTNNNIDQIKKILILKKPTLTLIKLRISYIKTPLNAFVSIYGTKLNNIKVIINFHSTLRGNIVLNTKK
jgi:hypothetical protein